MNKLLILLEENGLIIGLFVIAIMVWPRTSIEVKIGDPVQNEDPIELHHDPSLIPDGPHSRTNEDGEIEYWFKGEWYPYELFEI